MCSFKVQRNFERAFHQGSKEEREMSVSESDEWLTREEQYHFEAENEFGNANVQKQVREPPLQNWKGASAHHTKPSLHSQAQIPPRTIA